MNIVFWNTCLRFLPLDGCHAKVQNYPEQTVLHLDMQVSPCTFFFFLWRKSFGMSHQDKLFGSVLTNTLATFIQRLGQRLPPSTASCSTSYTCVSSVLLSFENKTTLYNLPIAWPLPSPLQQMQFGSNWSCALGDSSNLTVSQRLVRRLQAGWVKP